MLESETAKYITKSLSCWRRLKNKREGEKKLDLWAKRVLKELNKYAERDDCYECKKLLREFLSRFNVTLEELKIR